MVFTLHSLWREWLCGQLRSSVTMNPSPPVFTTGSDRGDRDFSSIPLIPFFILHSSLLFPFLRHLTITPHYVSSMPWSILEEGRSPLGASVLAPWYFISTWGNSRNLFYVVIIWQTWKRLHRSPSLGVPHRVHGTPRDLSIEFKESMNWDGKRLCLYFHY